MTDEKMLALLRGLAARLGRAPTYREVKDDPEMPSTSRYVARFGTLNKAIVSAGLTPRYRHYEPDELIAMLQSFARRLGRTPTHTEVNEEPGMPTDNAYAKHFGSYNEAVRRAGLVPNREVRFLDDEELLDALACKAQRLGRAPTKQEVKDDPEMPGASVLRRRFGSYNDALRAAGLMPGRCMTDQEMLAKLRAKASQLGRRPTATEMDRDPEAPCARTYASHFGSFAIALERAGYKRRRRHYTNQEILDGVRTLADELGRPPGKADMDRCACLPCARVCVNRFGSYEELILLAGLIPTRRRPVRLSDEGLIAGLKALAERLERAPDRKDVDLELGLPTSKSYIARFGSFDEALKRAKLI